MRFLHMYRRFTAALTIALAAICVVASSALADPAADLANAQAEEASAKAEVAAAEQAVKEKAAELAPMAKAAREAGAAATAALRRAKGIQNDLVEKRKVAADRIAAADASYRDAKDGRATKRAWGIALLIAAIVLGLTGLVWAKLRGRSLPRWTTGAAAGALGLAGLAGLGLIVLPSAPQPPTFSAATLKLAAAAKGDPARPRSPQLRRAIAEAMPLVRKAKPLIVAAKRGAHELQDAKAELSKAREELSAKKHDVLVAQRVVDREERREAAEEAFKAEADPIDYDQLIKNPYDYVGDKVAYTGQIFQVEEGLGSTVILLSVTNEGYGFWSDEIWVDYNGEIESAEEDIITIYGTVTGGKTYDTQIGGTNFVPRVKAKYIDE